MIVDYSLLNCSSFVCNICETVYEDVRYSCLNCLVKTDGYFDLCLSCLETIKKDINKIPVQMSKISVDQGHDFVNHFYIEFKKLNNYKENNLK